VKKLCDIHKALVHHPLYNEHSLLSHERNGLLEGPGQIADLQLGRLLALTVQLKEMTGLVGGPFDGGGIGGDAKPGNGKVPDGDNATILLALSCHERLDQLYTHAIEALREAEKKTDRGFDASYQLLSGLTVDGFSLGACHDFQLNFVLQLCEQARQRLGASLKRVRGAIALGNTAPV